MTHEYQYREHDIPELDAFLKEYMELCVRHGMQFTLHEYEGGGAALSIGVVSSLPYLNLDEIGPVAFKRRLDEESQKIMKMENNVRRDREHIERERHDRAEFERLKQKFGNQ